ncbi:MAG: hypothetical protein COB07_04395 [Sulfurovum sp.]|nr:MAG: hypothetical protein COB07_04395 [Sulfurovum sp.]
MLALTILSIFILIIVILIFIEYRNEKKYQKKRREQRAQKKHEPKKLIVRKAPRKTKAEPRPEPKPKAKPEPKPEPEVEVRKASEKKELPEAKYPEFTHIRLVEMGLSNEEAKEFVAELIPQLETEIPLLEAALKEGDFPKMERLTHGIKGSATNLGTGGVSDLLAEYNTYLKTGTDSDIVKAYLEHLIQYTSALKTQYS